MYPIFILFQNEIINLSLYGNIYWDDDEVVFKAAESGEQTSVNFDTAELAEKAFNELMEHIKSVGHLGVIHVSTPQYDT